MTTKGHLLSLFDRGANCGEAGTDVRLMFKPGITVYIKGLENHEFTDIPIGIVRGIINIQKEHDIIVLH